jgi:capsular exopolysaccharide synthesis family protein
MIRPRIQLNTLLGAGVGLILALGLVFLLELLDDTFRSLKDFSQSEEVNILGSIRKIRGKRLADKLVAHLHPHSPIAESYRIVRSRLRFKRGEGTARSIMITSSMPEEGKSLTAANLAVVFAQANYKTVVVDANLRHPVLHEVFGVRNECGLGDMLSSSEIQLQECLQDTAVNHLQILTSGTPLPDPSGQLGSERMDELIRELKRSAEIVIFDSPPALVFADAIVMSRRVDGVIMVIQAGKSKRSAINQTLLDLQNANADLLGSVFNQSPKSDTFSANKAYMQDRPKLAFARPLPKREGRASTLAGTGVLVHENVDTQELNGSQANVISVESNGREDPEVAGPLNENAEEQLLDLSDLAVPASHPAAEGSLSSNGFKPTQVDILQDEIPETIVSNSEDSAVEGSQSQELDNPVMATNDEDLSVSAETELVMDDDTSAADDSQTVDLEGEPTDVYGPDLEDNAMPVADHEDNNWSKKKRKRK